MTVFDMKHFDGKIRIEGLAYTSWNDSTVLTRAEVLALVKFAAELWPDQVEKLVHQVLEIADGDICLACGNALGDHSVNDAKKCSAAMDAAKVSGCDECGSFNASCGDCQRLHPERAT